MRTVSSVCIAAAGCGILLLGCPGPYRLGFPGPYPERGYHQTFREGLPITIFYPDTDPPMQNLPLIIFNAGFIQPRASYEGFGRQLAQWGYVVVIRTYASLGLVGVGDSLLWEHVAQFSDLIDWVAEENLRPGSPLYGMVDTTNVGTTGHSFGASVAIVAGVADPRVRAVVSLDVSYNGGDLDVLDLLPEDDTPYFYVAADSGGWCSIPPVANGRLFDYTNPPTVQATIAGADHMDFMDTPIGLYYLGYVGCPRGPLDDQISRDYATKYMVAWFQVHLKGQREFADYYNGTLADADEATGLISFMRKLEPVE